MADPQQLVAAHLDHRRSWKEFFYVYPVISRRSRGVSIGINLNPDKICNFNCVYCEVDRKHRGRTDIVDFAVLENELRNMLLLHQSGDLFRSEPFASTPLELRRLNDIAFSGDGEPTSFKAFAEVVELVVRVKKETASDFVKIILITDAAGLDRVNVKRGLEVMDRHQGEIWVKLDAGTESYFKQINRTAVRFDRILKNIVDTAILRPVCIQSLFLRIHGQPPSPEEIRAYIERLQFFMMRGAKIKEVQVYTVARPTPEPWATSLSHKELESIGEIVRKETGLSVICYFGTGD